MIVSRQIPVFCAIDTTDLARAEAWVRAASQAGLGLKFGKEFFASHGAAEVRRLRPEGVPLFLDLKLHDIPNTVAGAIRGAAKSMRPDFITIHASGGRAMIEAARAAAEATGGVRPGILAVTILTSLDAGDLEEIGWGGDLASQVLRLARLAAGSGADGLVAAAAEIVTLRKALPRQLKLVVPGIRPKGADAGDQKRVMTPSEALDLGADWLVIGRPITEAADPAAAARAIAEEVAVVT